MSREELWTQSVRHRASLRSPLKLEKHPLVRAHLWNRGTGALNNIHSEITCGVPVDWRLGNFNNVTLYIPQDHSLQNLSYQQHSHKTVWQSTYYFPLCTAQAGSSSRHVESGETQLQADLGQQKKGHCPWPQQCWHRGEASPCKKDHCKAAQGTTGFGMRPAGTQNAAHHP